jgi:crotonobetaine/carnitine-CoA ligase
MSKGSGSEVNIIRGMTLRAAEQWPDRTALVFDASGEAFTFAELESRTNRIANFLADEYGVAAGDRVALMLPNVSAYPLFWLALAKMGAITVPLNPAYRMEDARHLLTHSGACLIVTTRQNLDIVDEIRRTCVDLKTVLLINADGGAEPLFETIGSFSDCPPTSDIQPDTVTNIQYTSGTTGLPKGCLLTNRYWAQIADVIVTSMKPKLSGEDVILTAQPFSYIDPHWNLVVALCSGAKLVVLERFRPSQFWSKVAEYGVTFFYCLGAMPTLMLKMPVSKDETGHRVRRVVCSGIPADRHAELEGRYRVPWVEAYGTTETGADISDWSLEDHASLVGTGCLGEVSAYRTARVIDEDGNDVGVDEVGQLILKGPGIMLGYYRNEAATAAAIRGGWYHTGDLVRRDGQGRFFFKSRQKDMIRRGGENISAAEVEAVLQMHPDVVIAACVPVADELREEEVKAYLVLRDQDFDLFSKTDEIIKFSSDRLARFKIPRHWEFRKSLPMTPSERVKKNEILADAVRGQSYDRVTGHWTNISHEN